MLWNLKWQDEYDFRKVEKSLDFSAENTKTVFTKSFLRNRKRLFDAARNEFVINRAFINEHTPTRKEKRKARFTPVETAA